MRYHITYACGHDENVNLTGKQNSQEYADWLAAGLCKECYKAEKAKKEAEKADAEDVTKYVEPDTNIDIYLKNGATYLRGSQRTFIMGEIFAEAKSPAEKKAVAFDFRSAWRLESDVLLDLAIKSGVDIRLYAYDRGAEINRNVEIIGGKMVKDETISFDDYVWECQCPLIGG